MKKITLFFFFVSFCSYSQIHFLTHKDDKISYSEYDNLKHIASIDRNFFCDETVKRYYDNGTTLLYTIAEKTSNDKSCKVYIYPSGTIDYTTIVKVKDKFVIEQGTLKINGVNYFLNISSCNDELCNYWVFVNKKEVYNGSAPVIKK